MKYKIRYYMHGNKTSFYELIANVEKLSNFVLEFEKNYPSGTIQKIVKL